MKQNEVKKNEATMKNEAKNEVKKGNPKMKKNEAKKEATKKIKATETHKLVYDALDRKNDLFVLETETTARNTKCDVSALACNRNDCSIVVKNNTTCVRRFVEIWGHTDYVDVIVKKRERTTLFDSNKALAKKFNKFEYEKKPNVFKLDVKTAIAFIQLLIDTSAELDAKNEATAQNEATK